MKTNCASSSKTIFDQVLLILGQLSDEHYSMPLDVFNGSTIGQHFRHILDFYISVVRGATNGELNYSLRDRSLSIEKSTIQAKDAFLEIHGEIDQLSDDTPIKVLADFNTEITSDDVIVNSSVGRELMYAYDHAVHHLAIIKIGINQNFSEYNIDQNLGVAPSTVKHKALSHH
jgi:hypothetical protein